MPQGEHLARIAEEHLLMGDMPADPDRVHPHSGDVRAARTVEGPVGGIG